MTNEKEAKNKNKWVSLETGKMLGNLFILSVELHSNVDIE